MKKFWMTILGAAIMGMGVFVLVNAASAADLPKRAVITDRTVYEVNRPYELYAGADAGYMFSRQNGMSYGGSIGIRNEYFGLQGNYQWLKDSRGSLFLIPTVSYPFGKWRPYVGAGLGYIFNDTHGRYRVAYDRKQVPYNQYIIDTNTRTAYNIEAGVRYMVTDNISVLAKYNHIGRFDRRYRDINVVSTGLQVHF